MKQKQITAVSSRFYERWCSFCSMKCCSFMKLLFLQQDAAVLVAISTTWNCSNLLQFPAVSMKDAAVSAAWNATVSYNCCFCSKMLQFQLQFLQHETAVSCNILQQFLQHETAAMQFMQQETAAKYYRFLLYLWKMLQFLQHEKL